MKQARNLIRNSYNCWPNSGKRKGKKLLAINSNNVTRETSLQTISGEHGKVIIPRRSGQPFLLKKGERKQRKE